MENESAIQHRIRCPDCGAEMVRRRNSHTDSEFMGCSAYPDCTTTMAIPTFVRMIEAGAEPLPGFGS